MSDTSNLCTRCDQDNTRDSYFCLDCADYQSNARTTENLSSLRTARMLIAPDDDGERFIPMTGFQIHAMNERMANSPEPGF